MNDDQIMVECAETIDRPAEAVWAIVKRSGWNVLPQNGSEKDAVVFMQQRIDEQNDDLMMLHTRMTHSRHLPWSAFQARVRVEGVGSQRSRMIVSCLATPTTDPKTVEDMLRGMILLSLRSLKSQIEHC